MTTPEIDPQLSRIYSIPEVAKLLGWPERRTRRWLVSHNKRLDGQLLENVGRGQRNMWSVSAGALKQLAPKWFVSREQTEITLESQHMRLVRLEDAVRQAQGRKAMRFASPPPPALSVPPVLPALLKKATVARIVGLSPSTIYTHIKAGTFPQPVRIPGVRTVRWRRADIEAWIDALETAA